MSTYKELSEERKKLQEEGLIPEWYTTAGWQLFKDKYLYQADNVKEQFERIAKTAASYVSHFPQYKEAETKFFNLLWNGWLSPSTPVLANTGTLRGLSISCSGSSIGDSVSDFYLSQWETAMLSKNGFGTSAYLGNIRNRGANISWGGKASGVVPVFKDFVQLSKDISQGHARKGAWAGYLEITHSDFDELADYVLNDPDNANVGWIIEDKFVEGLNQGNEDYIRRYQKALKLKMVTGRGYFCFIDKINRKRPDSYVKNELFVKGSNLCDEITLFADNDHSFTCVLSSMNVAKYDEWKNTDSVYWATVFLDCIVEDFLNKSKDVEGLDKVLRFTKKGRALGLGQCGFHSYLQINMIPFESLEALFVNREIAKYIDDESLRASKEMASILGEPEWCQGLGIRNTHRIAIAPTKSTAMIMGGISEGINPDPAMVFTQTSAGGEMDRINPQLLKLMKERGFYNKKTITDLKDKMGSVQGVAWLTDDEKKVFKTAFEINQDSVVRMASQRAQYIDQWQSLNLFFSANENEEYISKIHRMAFEDENILGLYYIYSQAGVQASKDCESCM